MASLIKYDLPTLALVLVLVTVIVRGSPSSLFYVDSRQIPSLLKNTLTDHHLVRAFFTHALLNLTKHPLSCFPGPRLWACSRVPYVFSLQNGTLPMKIKALHDIYGPVVRVAPNELSFITPEAWKDIYCDKPHGFERSDIFYGITGQDSLIASRDEDHARMRGVLSPAFRVKAMRDCEGNMMEYVHLMMERLGLVEKNKARKGESEVACQDEVTVDIVRWLNFTTFDIIGNFVYGGEPFGCLRRGEFHPWVEMIFTWLESAVVFFSIRYYTSLSSVLLRLVPPSLIKQKEEFDRLGRDRVRKLMLSTIDEVDEDDDDDDDDDDGVESKKRHDRALPTDVLSYLKSSNHGGIMTLAEMEANLHLIIIAGSETVATMLSGTMNYLCQNASVLKTLTDEVRSAAHHKTDLTLATLSKLPYLTAVLKEGLRVVSPAPISLPRVVPAEGAFIAGDWVPGRVSLIRLLKNATIKLRSCSLRSFPPLMI